MVSRNEILENYKIIPKGEKLPHSCFAETIAIAQSSPLDHKSFEIDDPNADELIYYAKPISLSDIGNARSKAIIYQEKFSEIYSKHKINPKELKKAVSTFCDETSIYDYHLEQSNIYSRYHYFIEKKLSKEEAKACTLALSFYTGSHTKEGHQNQIMSVERRAKKSDLLMVMLLKLIKPMK